jgi:hypothetical protein
MAAFACSTRISPIYMAGTCSNNRLRSAAYDFTSHAVKTCAAMPVSPNRWLRTETVESCRSLSMVRLIHRARLAC